MFRDCLSRQIGEALKINFSKDVLLNSKAEYLSNSVSRLTIKEDAWEMRERTRLEEEQEELNKKRVEEFKKLKTANINHHGDDHTARGEKTGHYSGSHCSTQLDIRQFLKDGKREEFRFVSNPDKDVKDEPLDKMRIIRNKMIEARRAADREEARKSMAKQPPMREWEGEVVVHAREVDNAKVQDQSEVVVVGADVEALYPQPSGHRDSQHYLR